MTTLNEIKDQILNGNGDTYKLMSTLLSQLNAGLQTSETTEVEAKNILRSLKDATDRFENTLLHLACFFSDSYSTLVKWMIELGYKADARNGRGQTPLDNARHKNHASLIPLLQNRASESQRTSGAHFPQPSRAPAGPSTTYSSIDALRTLAARTRQRAQEKDALLEFSRAAEQYLKTPQLNTSELHALLTHEDFHRIKDASGRSLGEIAAYNNHHRFLDALIGIYQCKMSAILSLDAKGRSLLYAALRHPETIAVIKKYISQETQLTRHGLSYNWRYPNETEESITSILRYFKTNFQNIASAPQKEKRALGTNFREEIKKPENNLALRYVQAAELVLTQQNTSQANKDLFESLQFESHGGHFAKQLFETAFKAGCIAYVLQALKFAEKTPSKETLPPTADLLLRGLCYTNLISGSPDILSTNLASLLKTFAKQPINHFFNLRFPLQGPELIGTLQIIMPAIGSLLKRKLTENARIDRYSGLNEWNTCIKDHDDFYFKLFRCLDLFLYQKGGNIVLLEKLYAGILSKKPSTAHQGSAFFGTEPQIVLRNDFSFCHFRSELISTDSDEDNLDYVEHEHQWDPEELQKLFGDYYVAGSLIIPPETDYKNKLAYPELIKNAQEAAEKTSRPTATLQLYYLFFDMHPEVNPPMLLIDKLLAAGADITFRFESTARSQSGGPYFKKNKRTVDNGDITWEVDAPGGYMVDAPYETCFKTTSDSIIAQSLTYPTVFQRILAYAQKNKINLEELEFAESSEHTFPANLESLPPGNTKHPIGFHELLRRHDNKDDLLTIYRQVTQTQRDQPPGSTGGYYKPPGYFHHHQNST